MDTKCILDYLRALQQNNDREWYHAHKKEYQSAYDEFLQIIEFLMNELGRTEPEILNYEPQELTFKLVRDTRFSKDKSPYNPSFRTHISIRGKLPIPVGYYLMITPGASFLGGGLFADLFRDATTKVRDYIAQNGEQWQEVIHNSTFSQRFQVKGNALKKVPQGYDPAHPQAEYLKNKSWYVEYPLTDEQIMNDADFMQTAVQVFIAMKPFNDFLNRALVCCLVGD